MEILFSGGDGSQYSYVYQETKTTQEHEQRHNKLRKSNDIP